MLILRQPDSPAGLIQTNHGVEDLLKSAKLKNVSDQLVVGYRIGWVAIYSTGKDKVGLGLPVDIPSGAKPGDVIEVPAQHVPSNFFKEGATSVVFFVTDVRTARVNDPTRTDLWEPEREKIEAEAAAHSKAVCDAAN
jgi:hypothetical protein